MNSPNECLYAEPSGFFFQRYHLFAVLVFLLTLGVFKYLFFYLFFNGNRRGRDRESDVKGPAVRQIKKLYYVIKNCEANNFAEVLKVQKEELDIVSYSKVIEMFIQKNMLQKALELLEKLKEPDFFLALNAKTQEICVNGIYSIIRTNETIDMRVLKSLLKEVIEGSAVISEELLVKVVESFVLLNQSNLALKFFLTYKDRCDSEVILAEVLEMFVRSEKQLVLTSKFFSFVLDYIETHSSVEDIVHSLVELCINAEDMPKLDQLFTLLKDHKDKMSLGSYEKMVAIYGAGKNRERVFELGELLNKWQLKPNEKTYACLIENYFKCGLSNKVVDTYKDIENDATMSFNPIICITLMRVLSKKKQFWRIFKLYQDIKLKARHTLTKTTYDTLLDCCVECEDFHRIQEIFSDMINQRENAVTNSEKDAIEPDIVTYSILIKGICKADCMDKAMEVYEEVKSKNLPLDCTLFNCLLNGFVKSRSYSSDYLKLIADMKARQIKYNDKTYCILIKLYGKHKDIKRVLKTYYDMRNDGIKPILVVYACLLQACIKCHYELTALNFFEEMKEQGIMPDVVVYNIITVSYTHLTLPTNREV
eukprot:TRINITY_DN4160_c0_g3_i5.p1 TRINITY_DN4160_c0_g3~~TRINITY_DN4160_c0_g3_i5.p1  ORF type:complete len:593 (-),score=123.99 TRINITY_DN4160_c0_g3_i5:46-1824(-)